MTPTIEEVVKGLTKAQREAVLRATPSGTDHYKDFNGKVRRRLFSLGIFEHCGGFMSDNPRCLLTDLGLSVRSYLMEKNNGK